MTVKNIDKYHELNVEELNKLSTRELVNALESSRGRIICSCGKGNHCGDDVLTQEEQNWNQKQGDLTQRLKTILKDREDLVIKEIAKKQQKKKLRY